MREFCAFGLVLALTIIPAAGQEGPVAGNRLRGMTNCAVSARPDRLRGLTLQGDLVLETGRLAKLSSLRLPDIPPHRDAALAWLQTQVGQPVLVQAAPERDRWDRLSARIRLAGGSNSQDLAHGLVEAGLALVDPGVGDVFCQPELLALEETAREQSLGLWRDGRYNPIGAERTDLLRERIGTFTLVEGRIRTIGERAQRTYLNFGGHWAEDFTIIIPKKTWKLMADRGLGAAELKGRRIRTRGILESWQGTSLTILAPEMIERLAGERLPR